MPTGEPVTPDAERIVELLDEWLHDRLDEEARGWLYKQCDRIQDDAEDWVFFTSFSGVPRYIGKQDLDLSEKERRKAEQVRPGWDPSNWSVDQAGRTRVVLSLPADPVDRYTTLLDQVFETADVRESVALYQALPLLPHPEHHRQRAAEGIRSNITSVFNAVALGNPYPAEYLADDAWNQMVLKAVFEGSPLHRIDGLDARANSALADMMVDYAHERWSASRSVTPELWRVVGPFAEGATLDDLERVLQDDDVVNREAAALALASSPADRADEMLHSHPDLANRIQNGDLSWESWVNERFRPRMEAD